MIVSPNKKNTILYSVVTQDAFFKKKSINHWLLNCLARHSFNAMICCSGLSQ